MDPDAANHDDERGQMDDEKKPSESAEITKSVSTLILEEQVKSPAQQLAVDLIHSHGFEAMMGSFIMFNLVVMIIETDRTVTEKEENAAGHWTADFGYIALVIFIVEMALRIFALRCRFFRDPMNCFDFAIVCADAGCTVIGLVFGNVFPVSILRVFRLTKMARVSKVLRVFPELRLLMAGLMGSISAIWWGTVLLSLFLLVWSMVAVLFIHPLNVEIDYEGSCDRCPRAYSSVLQSTLTFSQQIVAGDSWGTATIPVIENHPITALFFLFVFLTIGMAVMNLILGVVVTVATEARDNVLQEDKAERMLTKLESQTHLLELCAEMDQDGSGELDANEIMDGYNRPGPFRTSMMSLDVTDEDLDVAFWLVDNDRSGTVEYKEFVQHIYNMRTSNTEHMLALIKYHMVKMEASLMSKIKENHDSLLKSQETARNFEIGLQKLVEVDEQEVQKLQEVEDTILGIAGKTISSAPPNEAMTESGAPSSTQPKNLLETSSAADELKDIMKDMSSKFDEQMSGMSSKFDKQMSDLVGILQAYQSQARPSPDLVVPIPSSRRLPACCSPTVNESDPMVSQSSIAEPRAIAGNTTPGILMRVDKNGGTSGSAGTN